MLLAILGTLIGLTILIYSADYFIEGASGIALKFGMPKFLIGMIVIGIGTSAPEIVVSVLSALAGSPGLALGNAYGSNIVNITLVLGATALISPLFIQKSLVKGDFLLLIGVTILGAVLLLDNTVSMLDGILLCSTLAVILTIQVYFAKKAKTSASFDDGIPETSLKMSIAITKLVGGLVFLVLSSRLVVWGAVEIAKFFEMSEVVIGLTVVAVGTSLPELVSSIIAAKKGEDEMALGNVIGSNIFNTLAVVGVPAIIAPMVVPAEILNRDIIVMGAVTLFLFVLCLLAIRGNQRLGRGMGGVLLAIFIGYTAYLIGTAA